MHHADTDEPTPEELAHSTAVLPEWDRLAVRDYWGAVVAEELGTQARTTARTQWSAMGSSDRARLRRPEGGEEIAALRLVTQVIDAVAQASPNSSVAA